jgi:hypothetical protein
LSIFSLAADAVRRLKGFHCPIIAKQRNNSIADFIRDQQTGMIQMPILAVGA